MGIIRHADAGYERANDNAEKFDINIPMGWEINSYNLLINLINN
jgi:urocanate hydratase